MISVWITILAITGLIILLGQCVVEVLRILLQNKTFCKIVMDESSYALDVVLILTILTQAYEWFVMNFIVDHQKVLFIAEAIEEMQDEEKKKAFEKKERK